MPDMPWAAAIALGAIVAPPDAAAATTVLKQLRPPHRLLAILEGESLFNDASALLIYRLAVGAAATGFVSGWSVVPTLLIVAVGSVVFGLVLSRLTLFVTTRVTDVATGVILQFCETFLVWILAERLHLSGIITLVVFALAASRRAPEIMPARVRIPTWAVWEVAVFVLNMLAFILIGFQLKSVAAHLSSSTGPRYTVFAATVCVAAILARIIWVTSVAAFSRWRHRPVSMEHVDPGTLSRSAAVVRNAWHCYARGSACTANWIPFPQSDSYDCIRSDLWHSRHSGSFASSAVADG